MKMTEVRKEAREVLKGKWGKGVSIILAHLGIALVLGFITGFFEEKPVLSFFFALVEAMISVPLIFGLEFVFLKLKRNEDVSAFEFINIGFENFSRCWKIAGRTILKLILPIILMLGSIFIYFGMVVYSAMQLTVGATTSIGTTMIIGTVIYILAIVYYIAVSLLYSLTSYIAYDNKEITASEVVAESARLMRGNRGKIILLELSFLGWAILATLTLGIGYLWLVPYMRVAVVCFYDRLVQSKTTIETTPDVDGPIQNM